MDKRRTFIDMVRDGEVSGFSMDPYNPALAYDTMDIYSPPGTRVRFTGYGGLSCDQQHGRQYLIVGEYYTVKQIEVGDWSSRVEFTEKPGFWFNTVMFEAQP